MVPFRKIAVAVLLGIALVAIPLATTAQEITPAQLAAALDVVRSAKASRGFDTILPNLVQEAENRLIAQRPDLHSQIVTAVEGAAMKLVQRRVDLDNDTARVWAKSFTEDELKTIATFYKTSAGQKFADVGPKVYADTLDVVSQWQDRLGDELLQASQDQLKTAGIQF